MMKNSLLKSVIESQNREREEIEKKVATSAIRASKDETEIVENILQEISNTYRDEISNVSLRIPEKLQKKLHNAIVEIAVSHNLDYETQKRVEKMAYSNIVGLGAITDYMEDDSVTEIIVQHWDNILIERKGIVEPVSASFMHENHLRNIIARIVQPLGKAINIQTPMVDARLADGSRVNATIPPVTPDGATLTIRKFSKKAYTGEDYLNFGSLNKEMLDFLAMCIKGRISLIVSGGTNTGKTTLLNMLSGYIPKDELIVTIEDSCELRLEQPNVRRMETRGIGVSQSSETLNAITIQDLVKNSLRMRPDRIIVGEIRDNTIVDLMSAMSTGHEGSMSTVHANSPFNLMNSRIPILYGMNKNVTFSETAQAIQVSESIDLVIQVEHLKGGKRVITYITEVTGLDSDNKIILNDIFRYDYENNKFIKTGYYPKKILDKLKTKGVDIQNIFKDR